MYRRAGTSSYRELLAKPKAAKAVADWFMQTNLLPCLSLAKELTRAKGGGQEVLYEKENCGVRQIAAMSRQFAAMPWQPAAKSQD